MITSKADLRRWGQLVNVIEFTTSIKMCVKTVFGFLTYLGVRPWPHFLVTGIGLS